MAQPAITFPLQVEKHEIFIQVSCQGRKLKGFRLPTSCQYQITNNGKIIQVPKSHDAGETIFPIPVDASDDLVRGGGTWWLELWNFEKTGIFTFEYLPLVE